MPMFDGKTGRRGVLVAVLVGAAVIASGELHGQPTELRRGLSLSASLVYTEGGLGGNDAAMRDAGFGDTDPGYCWGTTCVYDTPYPRSTVNHIVLSLSARYRHSRTLSAEFQMIDLPKRSTEGYRHDPATGFGSHSTFKRGGKVYIATIARHWKSAWFGAGPALVRSEWKIDGNPEQINNVGVALDAGVVLGRRWRFAPLIRAQYRAVDGGSVRSERSGVRAHGPDAEFHIGMGFGFAL